MAEEPGSKDREVPEDGMFSSLSARDPAERCNLSQWKPDELAI